MDELLLFPAAALCVVTAFVHSYLGEKRLITPVVNSDTGVMANPLAKQVMRLAWHWTSVLWALIGLYLALATQDSLFYRPLILAIGLFHLLAGLLDGWFTRGKHVGWPLITLIGLLVLAAGI